MEKKFRTKYKKKFCYIFNKTDKHKNNFPFFPLYFLLPRQIVFGSEHRTRTHNPNIHFYILLTGKRRGKRFQIKMVLQNDGKEISNFNWLEQNYNKRNKNGWWGEEEKVFKWRKKNSRKNHTKILILVDWNGWKVNWFNIDHLSSIEHLALIIKWTVSIRYFVTFSSFVDYFFFFDIIESIQQHVYPLLYSGKRINKDEKLFKNDQ